MTPYDDNTEHLEGELLLLNLLLHRHVLRWRASHHPDAITDELLGLYISDREIDVLLAGIYASVGAAPDGRRAARVEPDAADQLGAMIVDAAARHDARTAAALAAGVDLRLELLSDRLGLAPLETGIVMLALSVEIDRRYGRLFAYLNDDAGARAPTVDLVCGLYCGNLAERSWARRAFDAGAPLRRLRVVNLLEPTRSSGSLLDATIELEPAVVAYLLGSDADDPVIAAASATTNPNECPLIADAGTATQVAGAARLLGEHPATIVHIAGTDDADCRAVAAHISAASSTSVRSVDLRTGDAGAVAERTARAIRHCLLHGQALALELGEPADDHAGALDLLVGATDLARFVITSADEVPARLEARTVVHRVTVPVPAVAERRRLWQRHLNGCGDDVDLTELADRFTLSGGQISAAADRAIAGAAARGASNVSRAELFASCRRQSARPAAELVERVESIHGWDDLILPADHKSQLRALENWVRYRPVVYDEWGFANRVMLGRGLTVLFSGPAGTGKTMAAGILARHLGLELYRVDLSTVVSKYIGETEKNLGSVFAAAESSNAMLFFDEADALFGKRSEVKDSHDRYANIEVSYLLQRVESYEGVAVLATNFGDNLDPAFARRIHVTVEFPFPSVADRRRIWSALLCDEVPLDDVDIDFLARTFALTGGHIKNCALAAAFAAAADRRPVGMTHIVRAVAHELDKAKQPVAASAFGRFAPLLSANGRATGTVAP